MGRELASAAARWNHLVGLDFRPEFVAACDTDPATLDRFAASAPTARAYNRYQDLLNDPRVEAVYVAVPHDLHTEIYLAVLRAGKHLLGEKPFGIDLAANARILDEALARPGQLVCCSSEFPFFPGAQMVFRAVREGKAGRILDVRSGLLHSSDMDPLKRINWKRTVRHNGRYGCMGDLGMHAVHLPLRCGFRALDVRALLTKVHHHRPDHAGAMVPCDTWDNAVLACSGIGPGDGEFPMLFETKRLAPGHANTWFISIDATELSLRFSTRNPRTIETLPYSPNSPQARHVRDIGYESAYPAVTGGIFEFGFPDAIQQMLAAFCDELAHGRDGMRQPFYCATPDETSRSHALFDAALRSHESRSVACIA
ncbi:MAG: Gfo/Idh/MocA family oxidoreductase [Phycisphaerae bacterium]|nr:Gfo/Idh/MocA family oxidoreductase [Phycisphaerae bacterium]